MFTYFTFLYCYSVLSCIGLIKDLFLTNYNIVVSNADVVVKDYKEVYERNLHVVTTGLLPFFIFLEVVYYISDEYNYFLGVVQAIFCFYASYVIHRLVYINFENRNFEFDKYNLNSHKFIFRILNRDLVELYGLYVIPIYIVPILIGANRLVYDILFCTVTILSTLNYSNNENMVNYVRDFRTNFNLDVIDSKIYYIIKLAKNEYIKFLNKGKVEVISEQSENEQFESVENVEDIEDEYDDENFNENLQKSIDEHDSEENDSEKKNN